jgi:hypothetical protein
MPVNEYRATQHGGQDFALVEIDRLRARVETLEGALTHILELIEYQDRPVAQIKIRARMALAAEEGDKS